MIKLNKSRTGGIILFFIGLYMMMKVPDKTSLSYIMPYIYGIIIIILSLLLIIRSLFKKDQADVLVFNFKDIFQGKTGKMLLYILFVLGYIILLRYIGTVTATLIFVIGSYYYLGIRSFKSYLSAVIIFALCYILFAFLLGVHFPHGILY